MDNLAREKAIKVEQLNQHWVDPANFCVSAESALRKRGDHLLKTRCKLLLDLLKAWIEVRAVFNMKKKHMQGSVAHLLNASKFLVPRSVSNALIN